MTSVTVLGASVTDIECDSKGNSFSFHEVLDVVGGRRILTFFTCPNHFSVCQRADCIGDDSRAFLSQQTVVVPLHPVMKPGAPTMTTCQVSAVGVALNGVEIYARGDESCNDIIPSISTITDECGGFADNAGRYQYRQDLSAL